MTCVNCGIENIMFGLHEVEAMKFGNFKLKNWIWLPIYINLWVTMSYSKFVQRSFSGNFWSVMRFVEFLTLHYLLQLAFHFRIMCPWWCNGKMWRIFIAKRAIKGAFKVSQSCLVIKDLVTSGASMFETIELLNVVELKVTNVVVFINRKQKGPKLYRRLDYNSMPLSSLHTL
jgi:uridine monophosphate synthetase